MFSNNQQTKFLVPSFTHYKDMIEAAKWKIGHATLPTPILGSLSPKANAWCSLPVQNLTTL